MDANHFLDWMGVDLQRAEKGGAGSGNFGHEGRPGKVGGSASGSGKIFPKINSTVEKLSKEEIEKVSVFLRKYDAEIDDDYRTQNEYASYWIDPEGELTGPFYDHSESAYKALESIDNPAYFTTDTLVISGFTRVFLEYPIMAVQAKNISLKHMRIIKSLRADYGDESDFELTYDVGGRSGMGWANFRRDVIATRTYGETLPDYSFGHSIAQKGGPGSGFWGHAGRPGQVGGSARESFGIAPKIGTPGWNVWFKGSKAVEEDGSPVVVYHGTTRDFTKFTDKHGNPENHYGTAHYFTDSQEDVSSNYAGEGPDLTNRLEQIKEKIENFISDNSESELAEAYAETIAKITERPVDEVYQEIESGEIDIGDYSQDIAKSELAVENQGFVMPCYLQIRKPVIVDLPGETRFFYNYSYNENTGEEKESGTAIKLFQAMRDEAENYSNFLDMDSISDTISTLASHAMDYEEIKASDFEKAIREADWTTELMDYNDNMVGSGQFIADVYRRLGYDGIIMDAYKAFGPKKFAFGWTTGMTKVAPGAKHYVVFKPTQIKSVFNPGAFSNRSPDILKEFQIDK